MNLHSSRLRKCVLGYGANSFINLIHYRLQTQNGRLAMMAISGILTQAALHNGQGFPCKSSLFNMLCMRDLCL
jgi:hypothetical protein